MTGPHPAVARTRNAVRATLRGPDGVPAGGLALVACSGGPDSLALAAAAAFVAPRLGRRAGAVVVDHGLQPGSDAVAAEAAEVCRRLGMDPVVVVPVVVADGRAAPGGPEARARAARYAALEAAATRFGAVVLLGHTADDQAETVLLGLARGSGARSLAGMPVTRGILRRPFLGLRRADTVAACTAQGLRPWQDPTNTAEDALAGPRRSRVRTHVLPLLEDVVGPGVVEALARTADRLRDDAEVLEDLAERLLAEATIPTAAPDVGPPDAVVLDVDVLAAAPAALRHRALRRACVLAGSPPGAVAFAHVLALDALVVDWHGQGPVHLPGGRSGGRACGRLTVRTAGVDDRSADRATGGPHPDVSTTVDSQTDHGQTDDSQHTDSQQTDSRADDARPDD